MAQLGRISGPLLQENLERQGVDLKFRNDLNSTPLLYLDVNTKQVAVNYNGTPLADLYVNSPIETVNLAVTSGTATIGNFTLGGDTIQLSSGNMTLDAVQNINLSGLGTDNLLLDDAYIGTRTTDTNVILDPSGTGTVEFYANTTVDGNIHATQNITADGNLVLGSGSEDNITLNAEITNNLLPDQTDQFAIGADGKRFSQLYSPLLNGQVVNANTLAVGTLSNLGAPTGNVYYVAENGNDSNRGDHPQGPFRTIKRALDFADGSSGGPVTIYVLPGDYEEITPLVVPANTTICGLEMRNTIIRPGTAYQNNDIFHLTGETTIQNCTIQDFYYDSGSDTGYAFRFAPNAVINTRSPYIQNCSVITKGTPITVTAGATFSVQTQENKPRGITFNNDGTKMFIVGEQGDDVNEYTLSVGFDLSSTVTFIDSFPVTQCPNPTAVKFNADGTKMFVTGTSNSNVHQYALTTGFDVSTASFTQTKVITVDNDMFGLDFKPDGTKMYLTGNQNDKIYEFNLSSAFDISTATFVQDVYVNPVDDEPFGIEFNTDGSRIFIVGTKGNGVDEYTLSTPYDISTMEHMGFFSIGGNPSGIHISPDGLKMFIVGNQSDTVKSYTLGTSYRVSEDNDPRGFDSGNAGKGALVDGLSVTTTSEEASMLFHSVTLITPGVDALTMTNGVRVEWLNCFTYFANRGIYVTNGTGRTDNRDGSTVVYGGELRSIASANVYGNKGIEGDGDSVLCYLINHNLAYIGVGKRVDNDESRAIQANEVIKSNSAKIFFQTQDHTGDFRVGDNFAIDFKTGSTTLNLAAASFANYNSLVIEDASGITQIYADRLEVGDFILSGNTIQTRNLDLTLDSYATNNKIKFLANTNLEQKLTLQDGITISGNFTYTGEQIDNQLVLGANIGSDLNPSTTGTFNLGDSTDRWRRISASEINVSDIKLETNVITTTVSNADLEFRASGTGKILLGNNNLEVTNDITTNGTTNINNLNVSGNLTFSGAVDFTQPFTTEDINVERISVPGYDSQFEDIKIQTNFLTTTQSNSNLELRASGSGIIDIDNLTMSNNATVSGTFTVSDSNNFTTVNSEFDTGDIKIYQNVIETTNSNSDLELRSYTGRIKVADVFFDNPTTISTASSNLKLGGSIIDMSSANKYLLLSKGTTAQRDSNLGSLRYNTDNNAIEGFSTAYLHTRGVFSEDRAASITAHNTNDTLIFKTNDTTQGTLDSTKLTIHNLTANQISIDGNSIIAENSNSDLEIIATGNANVFFEDFEIQGNNIIQVNTNSGTTIGASGVNGLTQFGGTNGVQIPVGTTAERPGTAGTGQLRWNTDTNELEAYSGSSWGIAAGIPQNVSLQFVDDTNFENTLIFG